MYDFDLRTGTTATTATAGATKTGSSNSDTSVNETSSLMASEETSEVNSKTIEDLEAEIEELEGDREKNVKQMEALEIEIKKLADKAQDEVDKAIDLQKDIAEETKAQSKEVVKEQIAAYIAANKEEPGSMTRSQLNEGIANNIPDTDFGKAVAALVEATGIMDEVDYCLDELDALIVDTANIDFKLEVAKADLSSAEEAAEAAAAAEEEANCPPPETCDPIGFMAEDENGEMAQFDFIKDGDGDGEFNSTDDFLGAEDQWKEMLAADLDGNGSVTAAELDEVGIQVIKNKDGDSAKTITEQFGKDFSVDLTSYKRGGEYAGITDQKLDGNNNNVQDQELLGTFTVNTGKTDAEGNAITAEGYNTLDDIEYLQSEYGVEAGEVEQQSKDNIFASDVQHFADFADDMREESAEIRESIDTEYANLGFEKIELEEFQNTLKTESEASAAAKVENIKTQAEAQETKDELEAEEAQKEQAEEAEAQAEVEAEEEAEKLAEEEDKKKKEDEE